jgi:hypothetical protein
MAGVPFTIQYGGFLECHGLVRGEGDCLVVEYQTQDRVCGLYRRRPRAVRVPLADLEAVEIQRHGWFGRRQRLVIRAKSMLALESVPGSRRAELTLDVAPRDREAAEQFVAGLYE